MVNGPKKMTRKTFCSNGLEKHHTRRPRHVAPASPQAELLTVSRSTRWLLHSDTRRWPVEETNDSSGSLRDRHEK